MSSAVPRSAPVPPGSGRWLLPTTPRKAALTSVRIYHPMTLKGLIGWEAARAAAWAGGFRLLPGSGSIPAEVTLLLNEHGIEYSALALARANHPRRFLALVLDRSFSCCGVAKMAFDDRGRAALTKEAGGIRAADRVLSGAVRVPRLVKEAPGLLVLEPVRWLSRLRPWRLPAEVAYALGAYSREQSDAHGGGTAAHGDFAPWNLLRARAGWVLLDWEHSSLDRPPFFDLWHYLVQAHSLLGHPSERSLLDGLRGSQGWVRTAVTEYARGLSRPSEEAIRFFDDYLEASVRQLVGKSHKERHGLAVRTELQRKISAL